MLTDINATSRATPTQSSCRIESCGAALVVVAVLSATACGGSNSTPLGGECMATSDCQDGLSCVETVCRGAANAQGDVFWAQSETPQDALRIGVMTVAGHERQQSAGHLLFHEIHLQVLYSEPVEYPLRYSLDGIPYDEVYIVGLVVLDGVAAWGEQLIEMTPAGPRVPGDTFLPEVDIPMLGQINLEPSAPPRF